MTAKRRPVSVARHRLCIKQLHQATAAHTGTTEFQRQKTMKGIPFCTRDCSLHCRACTLSANLPPCCPPRGRRAAAVACAYSRGCATALANAMCTNTRSCRAAWRLPRRCSAGAHWRAMVASTSVTTVAVPGTSTLCGHTGSCCSGTSEEDGCSNDHRGHGGGGACGANVHDSKADRSKGVSRVSIRSLWKVLSASLSKLLTLLSCSSS